MSKQITVYSFSELSDSSKQKAIEDNRYISVKENWWENVYEDANNIGLKITSFDDYRGEIEGEL